MIIIFFEIPLFAILFFLIVVNNLFTSAGDSLRSMSNTICNVMIVAAAIISILKIVYILIAQRDKKIASIVPSFANDFAFCAMIQLAVRPAMLNDTKTGFWYLMGFIITVILLLLPIALNLLASYFTVLNATEDGDAIAAVYISTAISVAVSILYCL